MFERLALVVAAASMLIAGCSLFGDGIPKNRPLAKPPAPPCKLPGTKSPTCKQVGAGLVCDIDVSELNGGTYVYPDVLSVPRNATNVTIVWHLRVPGAHFEVDDGPLGLQQNPEFSNGAPTNDPNGAPPNATNGRKYRITFANSAASGAGPHDYTIQYRRGPHNRPKCDPQIISEAN